MARSVTIAAGKTNVQLPDGGSYDAGKTVTLTDAQFNQINSALIPGTVIDNGFVAGGDAVTTQGTDVANLAAATATAPVALTSVVAAGANPTKAEYDALRADVVALRTTLAAVVVDLGAHATTINAIDTNLTGTGKALA